MISHRASCFEGNTAVVYAAERSFSSRLSCEWADRHKICLASFVDLLDEAKDEADFPGIVVQAGSDATKDRFIEVHVFGPMTARTFEAVQISARKRSRHQNVLRNAIEEKLRSANVQVRAAR